MRLTESARFLLLFSPLNSHCCCQNEEAVRMRDKLKKVGSFAEDYWNRMARDEKP